MPDVSELSTELPAQLIIATRESELALWQSQHVKQQLEAAHPSLVIELLPMTTKGDQLLDTPLYRSGGKGLFVKELETALLESRADIAVHSMKDVPAELPTGLGIHALLTRADRRDAFVSNRYASLAELPPQAIVGTSSLRRQTILKQHRPDLDIQLLRGNVNTRIAKLDDGQYDAIILACAGLDRLGWQHRVTQRLPVDAFMPAPGQGIVGVECRTDDASTRSLLASLNNADATIELAAERACNARLGGGCHVPIAIRSELTTNQLILFAMVSDPAGLRQLTGTMQAARQNPLPLHEQTLAATQLGERLAEDLLSRGAAQLLNG